ncbi:uncharacterized protein [Antedon mediterranea]|uniref:uncharacterized protein n=1 Tax=Antedon mediterranea TaxID=105859 RepID=UPI003AF956B5
MESLCRFLVTKKAIGLVKEHNPGGSLWILTLAMLDGCVLKSYYCTRCPENWKLEGDVCRHYFNYSGSWAEQNDYCQREGATLPILKASTDFESLRASVTNSDKHRMFLGYSDEGHEGIFTEITCNGEKQTTSLEEIWKQPEPNNAGTGENCVEINSWSLNDWKCNTNYDVIAACQKDACPENFMYLGDSCYHFTSLKHNYISGNNICEELDSSLLVLDSEEELNFIQLSAWLGYNQINVDGFFEMAAKYHKWIDVKDSLNKLIGTPEENECTENCNAVKFNYPFSWEITNAEEELNVICERGSIVTETLHSTSEIYDHPIDFVVYTEKPLASSSNHLDIRLVRNYTTSEMYIGSSLSLSTYSTEGAEILPSATTGENSDLPDAIKITMIDENHKKMYLDTDNISLRIGEYYGRVEVGSGQMQNHIVILKEGSEINIEPSQRSVTVGLGETVTLTVNAPSATNLRWRHNNAFVYGEGMHDTKTLTILNARLEDEGVYECYYQGQRHLGKHTFMYLYVTECPTSYCGIPSCALNCPVCYNGGRCHARSCTCVCPPGFSGTFCEEGLTDCSKLEDCYKYSCSSEACRGVLFSYTSPVGNTCAAGLSGYRCYKECEYPYYGANCLQKCHCPSLFCHIDIGCTPEAECHDGFTGRSCLEYESEMVCPAGYFGDQCNKKCHCFDQDNCNKASGNCQTGCEMGWGGQDCQLALPAIFDTPWIVNRYPDRVIIEWRDWTYGHDFGVGPIVNYNIYLWNSLHPNSDAAPALVGVTSGNTWEIKGLQEKSEYSIMVKVTRRVDGFLVVGKPSPILSIPVFGQCSLGWMSFENHCFHINNERMSWNEADEYCKARQSHLAHITSANIKNFVLHMLQAQKMEEANRLFVGMKKDDEDALFWIGYEYTIPLIEPSDLPDWHFNYASVDKDCVYVDIEADFSLVNISCEDPSLGCPICQEENPCVHRLGIEDGTILDEQLMASSEFSGQYSAKYGRLNSVSGSGAWSSGVLDNNQWLQVDLGSLTKVTGVITQGRPTFSQWVTFFSILYSFDGSTFIEILDESDNVKVFTGNVDISSLVTNLFDVPIYAQFIRIQPLGWNVHISMRFEVLGCVDFTGSDPPGWVFNNESYYRFDPTPRTWNESEQYCSGNMAIISSIEENEFIIQSFHKLDIHVEHISIGYHHKNIENVFEWVGTNEWSEFENFGSDFASDDRCFALAIENGKWFTVPCNASPGGVVCEIHYEDFEQDGPTLTECKNGYDTLTDDPYACYKIHSWDANKCNGSHLVMFETKTESNTILEAARYLDIQESVYIGLYFVNGVDLVWEDGRKPDFDLPWASGQPMSLHHGTTECVVMDVDFEYDLSIVNCNGDNQFMCEYYNLPKMNEAPIAEWVGSEVNLNWKAWKETDFSGYGPVENYRVMMHLPLTAAYAVVAQTTDTTIRITTVDPNLSPVFAVSAGKRFSPSETIYGPLSPEAENEKCTSVPLGLEDGTVFTDQLSASSAYNNDMHRAGPDRGRLNTEVTNSQFGSWASLTNDLNQWIQVDFGAIVEVTGVILQGRSEFNQWVTSYEVLHSLDGINFNTIIDNTCEVIIFPGNEDKRTHVTSMFPASVKTQFIRIHPIAWHSHICLRFEVLGCKTKCMPNPCYNSGVCTLIEDDFLCKCTSAFEGQRCATPVDHCVSYPCQNSGVCNPIDGGFTCSCVAGFTGGICESTSLCTNPLGVEDRRITDGQISASSKFSNYHGYKGRLNRNSCWSAKHNDNNQWIQIDLEVPTTVSGVATQGYDWDGYYPAWIETYHVQYSNDGTNFDQVNDNGAAIIFTGNSDSDTVIQNMFPTPVDAQYICIQPLTYHDSITLRMEIYGCEDSVSETVNPCDSDPCQNSGVCSPRGAEFFCLCSSGFEGDRCETEAESMNLEKSNSSYCECYEMEKGEDYRGSRSTTMYGSMCHRWGSSIHLFTPENSPDAGLGDHNFCRNPESDYTVWCYTATDSGVWEYCDIGTASELCPSVEDGLVGIECHCNIICKCSCIGKTGRVWQQSVHFWE